MNASGENLVFTWYFNQTVIWNCSVSFKNKTNRRIVCLNRYVLPLMVPTFI